MKVNLFIFFFLLVSSFLFGQTSNLIDSTSGEVKMKPILHSPKKATYLSMALPGLGQAYNNKYWKIPVIYASLATLIYFEQTNGTEFRKYRDAYITKKIIQAKVDTTLHDLYPEDIYGTYLIQQKEYYRRYRDLSRIAIGLVYVLNIVDAAVDAHFFTFDVSDDLSLKVTPFTPVILQGRMQPGIGFNLIF